MKRRKPQPSVSESRRQQPNPSASEVLSSRRIATASARPKKRRLRSVSAGEAARTQAPIVQPIATSGRENTSPTKFSVPSEREMSDEQFFKHFNARHLPDVLDLVPIRYRPGMTDALVRAFRAYHRRMHMLHDHYEHFHLED